MICHLETLASCQCVVQRPGHSFSYTLIRQAHSPIALLASREKVDGSRDGLASKANLPDWMHGRTKTHLRISQAMRNWHRDPPSQKYVSYIKKSIISRLYLEPCTTFLHYLYLLASIVTLKTVWAIQSKLFNVEYFSQEWLSGCWVFRTANITAS